MPSIRYDRSECLLIFSLMYWRAVLFFNCILCYSCVNEPVTTTKIPTVRMDLSGASILRTADLLQNATFIHPELTENSGIDQIEKIVITDHTLLIVNYIQTSSGKAFLAFDLDGRFRWHRLSYTDAPGKFTGYADFVVRDQNEIEILDALTQRIVKYDLKGNYLSSVYLNTDARRLIRFEDGSYAFHRNNSYQFGKDVLSNNIVFANEDGERQGTSYLFIRPIARDMKLSGERFFVREEENSYFCTNPPSDTIYKCSPGVVAPLFSLEYLGKAAKDAALEKLAQDPSLLGDRGTYNLAFLEFLNNPNFIVTYDLIAERDRYFILSFRKGGVRYFAKVDKESLQAIVFKLDDDLLNETELFLINKDTFVLALSNPYVLKSWFAEHAPQLIPAWLTDLTEVEPNPVIISIDLKEIK